MDPKGPNPHFNHPQLTYDENCVACLQSRVAELEALWHESNASYYDACSERDNFRQGFDETSKAHLASLARLTELETEIERLKDCAREQEKGIGAKTMRVELLAKPDNRFAVCVTFPSGMEDGERKAAETAIHTISLVYETAKALAAQDEMR